VVQAGPHQHVKRAAGGTQNDDRGRQSCLIVYRETQAKGTKYHGDEGHHGQQFSHSHPQLAVGLPAGHEIFPSTRRVPWRTKKPAAFWGNGPARMLLKRRSEERDAIARVCRNHASMRRVRYRLENGAGYIEFVETGFCGRNGVA
jgi:hypothetical protein